MEICGHGLPPAIPSLPPHAGFRPTGLPSNNAAVARHEHVLVRRRLPAAIIPDARSRMEPAGSRSGSPLFIATVVHTGTSQPPRVAPGLIYQPLRKVRRLNDSIASAATTTPCTCTCSAG